MSAFSLTGDQAQAQKEIFGFIADPTSKFHVLEGYSGTGKTTLMQDVLKGLRTQLKSCTLITPSHPGLDIEVALTATTHKAAEALSEKTGMDVTTVFSYLGLRVHTNYGTGATSIVGDYTTPLSNVLLVIDEASYTDDKLLKIIVDRANAAKFVKVLFIGDPAQLLGVGAQTAPVFNVGFPTSRLTQVVRQAEGNPIIDLSTMLRNAVYTKQFQQFHPDGNVIQHLDGDTFMAKACAVFSEGKEDSRILAWRNKTVTKYNNYIAEHLTGHSHMRDGSTAFVNSYVHGKEPLKNNETVTVHAPLKEQKHGVDGCSYLVRGRRYFVPDNSAEHSRLLQEFRAAGAKFQIKELMETWADLRPAYAQTINKSQGSTYDSVFIDLNDVGGCFDKETIARLLYVGASRARHNVYLFGDIK